jgi:hypothetical protein
VAWNVPPGAIVEAIAPNIVAIGEAGTLNIAAIIEAVTLNIVATAYDSLLYFSADATHVVASY